MIKEIISQMFGIKVRERVYKINGVSVKVQYSGHKKAGRSGRAMKIVVEDVPKNKKDKYVLSSIYPNEEVMRRVDRILLDVNFLNN